MPFDDAQQPDFEGGGGGVTNITRLIIRLLSTAQAIDRSEDEGDFEAFYACWDALTHTPSSCIEDVFLKVAALNIRYHGNPITLESITEDDAKYLDSLVMESIAFLDNPNGIAI